MSLRNKSLDAAQEALDAIAKGHAARQRNRLRKSIHRLRDHFGLYEDAPHADASAVTAARERSRSTEQRAPEPQTDAAVRQAGPIPVDGPEWIPLHQRLVLQDHARMLQGVAEAQADIDARQQEQALSEDAGTPGADSRRRMAAAKARPNSTPMPRP